MPPNNPQHSRARVGVRAIAAEYWDLLASGHAR